jgi:Lrp/AsnC family transcriptional regulator for asnA, asnC and gidA
MLKMDELDQAIIKFLHEDGRMPSAEIARELKQSPRTVQNRIQRLVDQGVIQISAVVSPAAFGFGLVVDIFCEIEPGLLDQAIEELLKIPNVTYISISTGEEDINLQVILRDSSELHAFITQRLHQVTGMQRTRTVLLPRILKSSHQWFPPDEAFRQPTDNSGSR